MFCSPNAGHVIIAELLRSRNGALWVKKYGNLCFWKILVLRKSCVRPPVHVSGCEMPRFNTICVKLGIGHPCCDQLTAVKKGYPLTSVTWLHRGLRYTTHRSEEIFQSYPLTSCSFLIDRRRRSIFLKVEFSLLPTYGQSIIHWRRHFLKHPSRASLSALAKSIYYKLKARGRHTPNHVTAWPSTSRMRTAI